MSADFVRQRQNDNRNGFIDNSFIVVCCLRMVRNWVSECVEKLCLRLLLVNDAWVVKRQL